MVNHCSDTQALRGMTSRKYISHSAICCCRCVVIGNSHSRCKKKPVAEVASSTVRYMPTEYHLSTNDSEAAGTGGAHPLCRLTDTGS